MALPWLGGLHRWGQRPPCSAAVVIAGPAIEGNRCCIGVALVAGTVVEAGPGIVATIATAASEKASTALAATGSPVAFITASTIATALVIVG